MTQITKNLFHLPQEVRDEVLLSTGNTQLINAFGSDYVKKNNQEILIANFKGNKDSIDMIVDLLTAEDEVVVDIFNNKERITIELNTVYDTCNYSICKFENAYIVKFSTPLERVGDIFTFETRYFRVANIKAYLMIITKSFINERDKDDDNYGSIDFAKKTIEHVWLDGNFEMDMLDSFIELL